MTYCCKSRLTHGLHIASEGRLTKYDLAGADHAAERASQQTESMPHIPSFSS